MSVNPHEGQQASPLGYHERVALVAGELAAVLPAEGLEATLGRAQLAAQDFNHDYVYLMNEAAGVLFRSGDAELQEHGLGYLAWEAEQYPDPAKGDGISYDAKYDARQREHREFARRCFEVSLMHFRFTARQEGYAATPDFFDSFNAAIARIEEEGFRELHTAAIIEFAPVAIRAAQGYVQIAEHTGHDDKKRQIDEVLERAVVILRESDPATAAIARSLITDELVLSYLADVDTEDILLTKLEVNDFESAGALLAANPLLDIGRLWSAMRKKLTEGKPESAAWAGKVLDTIKSTVPNYFSQHEYVDFFLDGDVGVVAGMTGRVDIIDDMIGPERDPTMIGVTTIKVAYGLGLSGNQAGFNHLLSRIPRFDPKIRKIVVENFHAGYMENVTKK